MKFFVFLKSFEPPPSIEYAARVHGLPQNPINGRSAGSNFFVSSTALNTYDSVFSSNEIKVLISSGFEIGLLNLGPSPSWKASPRSNASGIVKISENKIDASRSNRSIGYNANFAHVLGSLHISRKFE